MVLAQSERGFAQIARLMQVLAPVPEVRRVINDSHLLGGGDGTRRRRPLRPAQGARSSMGSSGSSGEDRTEQLPAKPLRMCGGMQHLPVSVCTEESQRTDKAFKAYGKKKNGKFP